MTESLKRAIWLLEDFLSPKEIAHKLGLSYWAINRALKAKPEEKK